MIDAAFEKFGDSCCLAASLLLYAVTSDTGVMSSKE